MDTRDVTFRFAGDRALLAEFENEISLPVNRKVRALQSALEQARIPGVGELLPTYRTLLIHYDPMRISTRELLDRVRRCAASSAATDCAEPAATVVEIPVCYEGAYAADIAEIARLENTSVSEIIRLHSQSDYYVYMLGFSPGHPYCARMEHPFSFQRRATPRVKIPAGSIVVQLGLSDIIPFDQPCGWNIIGTTPVPAFDRRKENPFLLRPGQWIRHVPIDTAAFLKIREAVEAGAYVCKTYRKEATHGNFG